MLEALATQCSELAAAVSRAVDDTEARDISDRAHTELVAALAAHAKAFALFGKAAARMTSAVSIGERRERMRRTLSEQGDTASTV